MLSIRSILFFFVILVSNDDHGIHCGCGGHGRVHGSCCGNVFWNGVANGICTIDGRAVCGHHAAYARRTSPLEFLFHKLSFHPAIALHLRHRACPRIRRRQNPAGCGPPRRSSEGRTFRRRFRLHASRRTIPNCRRRLCTEGPTRDNVPFYFMFVLYCDANSDGMDSEPTIFTTSKQFG